MLAILEEDYRIVIQRTYGGKASKKTRCKNGLQLRHKMVRKNKPHQEARNDVDDKRCPREIVWYKRAQLVHAKSSANSTKCSKDDGSKKERTSHCAPVPSCTEACCLPSWLP